MAAIMAMLLAIMVSGCASSGGTGNTGTHEDYIGPVPVLTGSVERAYLAIGVLSASRVAYGQTLNCPGADQDMQMVSEKCEEHGIPGIKLLSQAATWQGVKDCATELSKDFGPEDLFVLSLSGHGGYVKDTSGDEASGYDSTLCLYDGAVLDDDVWAFIQTLPPCRIFLVTDTCHAEGSWRAWVPFWNTAHNFSLDTRRGQWAGSIVQLAACREAESALGGSAGGQWTSCLYDTLSAAQTLQGWFDDAAQYVTEQTPTISTYGPLAGAMLAEKPLE